MIYTYCRVCGCELRPQPWCPWRCRWLGERHPKPCLCRAGGGACDPWACEPVTIQLPEADARDEREGA